MTKKAVFPAVVLSACVMSMGAYAQDNYPDRAITLITPYSTGGDSDLAARNFAAVAHKHFGQPVVVQNKPGASGVIGSELGRKSKPDGYTLLLARVGSQAILPAIAPTRTGYKWDGFTNLAILEINPFACYVKGDSDLKSYADLEKRLREDGASMNYGTAGTMTLLDMAPRLLFNLLELKEMPTEIPYKGTGEAMTALLGNQIDFNCSSMGPAFGLLSSGELRALFVTTPERLKALPDVPTVSELGLAEMEKITGWSGISGPPDMPKELVAKIWDAIEKTGQDPEWIKLTENAGSIPFVKNPQEAYEYNKAQYEVYHNLGKSLDLIDKL